MKNTITTAIDLNVLLAEVERSKRNGGALDENIVLKLTVEWELDIDQIKQRNALDPSAEFASEAGATTADQGPDVGRSDDWRATVAQFPDD